MTLIIRHSIAHPWRILVLAALVLAAAAPGVLRLTIRTDGHALVPADAPAIREDRAVREEFGIEDFIVVVIRSAHSDGLFNTGTLQLVQRLTDEFQAMDGVRPWNVISLATERGDRVRPGTLIFRTFLEPMPETPEELARLREDLRAIELYDGILVSYDEKATSILVGIPEESDRTEMYRKVHRIIEREGAAAESVYVIGAPVAEALLGLHILQDLGVPAALLPHHEKASGIEHRASTFENRIEGAQNREVTNDELRITESTIGPRKSTFAPLPFVASWLRGFVASIKFNNQQSATSTRNISEQDAETAFDLYTLRVLIGRFVGLVPVALFLMAVVFLVSFRSAKGVALPLMEVGACLTFVFGLMGWTGVPVYLTIAVMPVILTAMGVADEIHLFDRYRALLRSHPQDPHDRVLAAAMSEMSVPVVQTSLTTSIAFLSFALSPIAPVRAFGIFTATGILFCMVWSLCMIPALLTLMRPRRREREAEDVEPTEARTSPSDADANYKLRITNCAGATDERNQHGRRFGLFARGVLRWRVPIVLLALGVVAVAPLGIRRIVVQDSWIDGFAPQSEFYRATTYFNEQFLGTHILHVVVDASADEPPPGLVTRHDLHHHGLLLPREAMNDPDEVIGYTIELHRLNTQRPELPRERRYVDRWSSRITEVEPHEETGRLRVITTPQNGSPAFAMRLTGNEQARYTITPRRLTLPEVIRRVDGLEAFLRERRGEAVGGVLGPGAYLRTVNFLSLARRQEARRIPDGAERIDLLWSRYGQTRGDQRLRQVVNEDYSRAVVSAYMKNANFVDTGRLMKMIREYEREKLRPHGITLSFAGDVAVSQTLIEAIVNTQVKSLIASLAGVLLVSILVGRSLVWGVFCVLPCALAVLVNFAVMGWTGMPLGVATSMFSGMTLGIGVDFAIHFLARFRRARAGGLGMDASIEESLRVAGPAIFIDAMAVGLGFGVLTLSQVPANARLGYLVMLSIVNCFIATIALLPALLRLAYGRGRVA